MDLRELLERQAKAQAEKPAVIFRGQPISFRQLREVSFSAAAGLSSLGLSKGDKAAIFLPNTPEYIYSLLGVFILRGTAVPLDFMLTEEELVNFINHSEAKVLIAQEKKDIRLAQIKTRCPGLREIVCIGADNPDGFTPWQQFLDSGKGAPQANADDKD